jgi:hypothetical protein
MTECFRGQLASARCAAAGVETLEFARKYLISNSKGMVSFTERAEKSERHPIVGDVGIGLFRC